MVPTFLRKQSGMLLVEVTSRDWNVEPSPIGVDEVEPAVSSFVLSGSMSSIEGRDSISKHRKSEHP